MNVVLGKKYSLDLVKMRNYYYWGKNLIDNKVVIIEEYSGRSDGEVMCRVRHLMTDTVFYVYRDKWLLPNRKSITNL